MAEEVKIPSKEELLNIIETDSPVEVTETPVVEAVELDPIEQQAVEQGWQPKEEWVAAGKDPRGWRDAASWIDRGEFFRTISSLKNELTSTRQQVATAFETGRRMAAEAAKAEIADLKSQRKEAMLQGDFEKVDKLETKIENVQDNLNKPVPQAPVQAPPPPEYDIFVNRNPWYLNDPVLHHAADGIGYEFARVNRTATPAQLYQFVEDRIREKFPETFKGSGPKMPPSPGGGNTSPRGSGAAGSLDKGLSSLKNSMSDMERDIMKTLIKTKVFKTEEDYLREYQKAPAYRR